LKRHGGHAAVVRDAARLDRRPAPAYSSAGRRTKRRACVRPPAYSRPPLSRTQVRLSPLQQPNSTRSGPEHPLNRGKPADSSESSPRRESMRTFAIMPLHGDNLDMRLHRQHGLAAPWVGVRMLASALRARTCDPIPAGSRNPSPTRRPPVTGCFDKITPEVRTLLDVQDGCMNATMGPRQPKRPGPNNARIIRPSMRGCRTI
jgi:hypothetical protein